MTTHRATSTHGQVANVEELEFEEAKSILSWMVSSDVRLSMLYGMKYG